MNRFLNRSNGKQIIRFSLFFLILLVLSCQNESNTSAPISTALVLPDDPAPGVVEEIPAKALLITERAFVRVAKQVTPAVVNISSVHFVRHPKLSDHDEDGSLKDFLKDFLKNPFQRNFRQKNLGSGFIFNKEGFIMTNQHVIADADKITVRLSDRREFIGQIIAQDEKRDLAVIKIPPNEDLPVAPLGDSAQTEIGEWAIAIGNPFGLDRTVTVGVISGTGRSDIGVTDQEHFLQTDASINFGNSGGPLLNASGKVIGINTAIIATGTGIGFAIPINSAKAIIRQWIAEDRFYQQS
ncbi:MAG: trypsin-like peptidase domain-containing protein [Nitrospiria bacterium]